ncbi:hypothetical protein E2C01_088410 [Portunus trituberculatus]|uniref:Secreted protein n=1 Tax=Portunus trituberculatus TaxID=210409 RepID=A0A5B7JGI5_PORTR|nr:hypothetical protein [Portunus trituberculatus]
MIFYEVFVVFAIPSLLALHPHTSTPVPGASSLLKCLTVPPLLQRHLFVALPATPAPLSATASPQCTLTKL